MLIDRIVGVCGSDFESNIDGLRRMRLVQVTSFIL